MIAIWEAKIKYEIISISMLNKKSNGIVATLQRLHIKSLATDNF